MKRILFAMMVLMGCASANADYQYYYSTVMGLVSVNEGAACNTFPTKQLNPLFPAWPTTLETAQVEYDPNAHSCIVYMFNTNNPPGTNSNPCPFPAPLNTACTTVTLNENVNATPQVQATINYQPGTWIPDVKFGGNNAGLVYAATGDFQVVGDYVEGSYAVSISNKGTSTGTITLGALPYPADNTLAANSGGAQINSYSGFTALPGVPWMYVDTNNVLHMVYGNTTGFVSLSSSVLTNTSAFRGTFKYKIAQ